ncbi:hypothetical protein [Lignipirellula cremea]|uniref:Uncharacterized protein n=1 Tax=Lignipirellula cremea TaxID=2528010 RepID=A0A518E0C6_9BACT|nr:hypothetical protein [Lignipirellula cremea]QDU97511.1 hypothetical protein Pla8534_53590 [Lignipirellula cremea]
MTTRMLTCDRGVFPQQKTWWRRLFEEADYLRSVPEPTVAESVLLLRVDHEPRLEQDASAVIEKYKRLIRRAREQSLQRAAN